ncbi:MAG UNVERIFIED_CONTAM: hypothetical protein LVR29_24290 [Microcystis novacekii LVE1205-3]|jgi:hypothetical protein
MRMVEKSNKKLDSFQSDPSLSILIKTELEEAYNLKKNLLTETKYLEKNPRDLPSMYPCLSQQPQSISRR